MGRKHASCFAKMPHVELVGVCDAEPSAAAALAERLRTAAFISFEEMIANADPDVVSICLPTPLHKEYVLKAADCGKHAICEKPIAPSLADAREMIDVCRSKGVHLFIGHVVRFYPGYADMRRKVSAGVIGKVGVAHASRSGSHPGGRRAWYKDPSASGGVILDLMIHDIDFMRSLFGDVVRVFALNRRTDAIDHALVTLRFQEGTIANLEAFWGFPGKFTTAVELAGTKGIIRYDSNRNHSLKMYKRAAPGEGKSGEILQSPMMNDPYYRELLHFIDCIENGATPLVTAQDGYKALEVALAAIESIRTGAPVEMGRFAAGKGGA
jgi:predicted dehydrogenase